MVTLTVDEIVSKVRIKLDEIAANESEMTNMEEDNRNLNTVIKSCIPGAYSLVATLADSSMLEGKQIDADTLSISDNLVGVVPVPDNTIRVISVRLSSWNSACTQMIGDDSQEYKMQSNKWVKGNVKRPAAAFVQSASGRRLELYRAATKNDTLMYCTYMEGVEDTDTTIPVPSRVVDSFIYFTAALAMVTFREEVADDLFKVARSLIGLQ